MDEFVKTRLILAARTGKLTEEQYAVYLKLLEEDPDFRDQVEWEGLLDKTLPVTMNAKLYAAADAYVFPVHRTFLQQYGYAIAASVTVLLLVAGWLVFSDKTPVMVGARQMDVYSGDTTANGQLGYAKGDLPAGTLPLQWYDAPSQKSRISYRLCGDTLALYFQKLSDTTAFSTEYRLIYFPESKNYLLESQNKRQIKLENCSKEPQPLLK